MSGEERARVASEKQLFESVIKENERRRKYAQLGKDEPPLSDDEYNYLGAAWFELFYKRGAKADPYVLKMLYYYFDETTNGQNEVDIYCRRNRVLLMLRKMKKQGLRCDTKYPLSCVSQKTWKESVVPDIESIIKDDDPLRKKHDCSKKRGEY